MASELPKINDYMTEMFLMYIEDDWDCKDTFFWIIKENLGTHDQDMRWLFEEYIMGDYRGLVERTTLEHRWDSFFLALLKCHLEKIDWKKVVRVYVEIYKSEKQKPSK